MSIKIETAVFCRNPRCCASGMLYNHSWSIEGRCPFCNERASRIKDHIRIPTSQRLVERTAVVTTYRADGTARLEVTA